MAIPIRLGEGGGARAALKGIVHSAAEHGKKLQPYHLRIPDPC